MNITTNQTGTELSDQDLEAISGGCHRRCDDDNDYEERHHGCDYKRDDDDYCWERPRHCHPRHNCG